MHPPLDDDPDLPRKMHSYLILTGQLVFASTPI